MRIVVRHQFGFRAGHLVEDQLTLSYNDITFRLDDEYMTDLIFFDFSKVIDLVNYNVLSVKLSQIGISGSLLSWINEFLRGTLMKVVVGGLESVSAEVCRGVSQGSVLGHTLSNI